MSSLPKRAYDNIAISKWEDPYASGTVRQFGWPPPPPSKSGYHLSPLPFKRTLKPQTQPYTVKIEQAEDSSQPSGSTVGGKGSNIDDNILPELEFEKPKPEFEKPKPTAVSTATAETTKLKDEKETQGSTNAKEDQSSADPVENVPKPLDEEARIDDESPHSNTAVGTEPEESKEAESAEESVTISPSLGAQVTDNDAVFAISDSLSAIPEMTDGVGALEPSSEISNHGSATDEIVLSSATNPDVPLSPLEEVKPVPKSILLESRNQGDRPHTEKRLAFSEDTELNERRNKGKKKSKSRSLSKPKNRGTNKQDSAISKVPEECHGPLSPVDKISVEQGDESVNDTTLTKQQVLPDDNGDNENNNSNDSNNSNSDLADQVAIEELTATSVPLQRPDKLDGSEALLTEVDAAGGNLLSHSIEGQHPVGQDGSDTKAAPSEEPISNKIDPQGTTNNKDVDEEAAATNNKVVQDITDEKDGLEIPDHSDIHEQALASENKDVQDTTDNKDVQKDVPKDVQSTTDDNNINNNVDQKDTAIEDEGVCQYDAATDDDNNVSHQHAIDDKGKTADSFAPELDSKLKPATDPHHPHSTLEECTTHSDRDISDTKEMEVIDGKEDAVGEDKDLESSVSEKDRETSELAEEPDASAEIVTADLSTLLDSESSVKDSEESSLPATDLSSIVDPSSTIPSSDDEVQPTLTSKPHLSKLENITEVSAAASPEHDEIHIAEDTASTIDGNDDSTAGPGLPVSNTTVDPDEAIDNIIAIPGVTSVQVGSQNTVVTQVSDEYPPAQAAASDGLDGGNTLEGLSSPKHTPNDQNITSVSDEGTSTELNNASSPLDKESVFLPTAAENHVSEVDEEPSNPEGPQDCDQLAAPTEELDSQQPLENRSVEEPTTGETDRQAVPHLTSTDTPDINSAPEDISRTIPIDSSQEQDTTISGTLDTAAISPSEKVNAQEQNGFAQIAETTDRKLEGAEKAVNNIATEEETQTSSLIPSTPPASRHRGGTRSFSGWKRATRDARHPKDHAHQNLSRSRSKRISGKLDNNQQHEAEHGFPQSRSTAYVKDHRRSKSSAARDIGTSSKGVRVSTKSDRHAYHEKHSPKRSTYEEELREAKAAEEKATASMKELKQKRRELEAMLAAKDKLSRPSDEDPRRTHRKKREDGRRTRAENEGTQSTRPLSSRHLAKTGSYDGHPSRRTAEAERKVTNSQRTRRDHHEVEQQALPNLKRFVVGNNGGFLSGLKGLLR